MLNLFVELLKNLKYYTHKTINKLLFDAHKKLVDQHNITDNDTIYVFIKSDDGQSNSSNDYLTEYKRINNLYNNLCHEDFTIISDEAWEEINNMVFIDDCSGSGKSFIDELKKEPDKFRKKNVFFIAIHFMKEAIDKISDYCTENDINIYFIHNTIQDKAFSENIFGEIAMKAKEDIKKMSKMFLIPKNHILGLYKTQSLMAFYNNTPNNTLGFIRFDTDIYKSLFPRTNDPIPHWMKIDRQTKKQQQIDNYNAHKRNI